MRNKPEDLLWSLKMIKRASESHRGCIIRKTGGFIADGQVDDLIELVEQQFGKSDITERVNKAISKEQKPVWFQKYWSEKGLKKNE